MIVANINSNCESISDIVNWKKENHIKINQAQKQEQSQQKTEMEKIMKDATRQTKIERFKTHTTMTLKDTSHSYNRCFSTENEFTIAFFLPRSNIQELIGRLNFLMSILEHSPGKTCMFIIRILLSSKLPESQLILLFDKINECSHIV